MAVARYALISALLGRDDTQHALIFQHLNAACFDALPQFLFRILAEAHTQQRLVDTETVRQQIQRYATSPQMLTAAYYDFDHLILALSPTRGETKEAVALLLMAAQRRGLIASDECTAGQLDLTPARVPIRGSALTTELPHLDLDVELFQHRRTMIADFAILAALLNGSDSQRQYVLQHLYAASLTLPFEQYLFQVVKEHYHQHGTVERERIRMQIPEIGQEYFGADEPVSKAMLAVTFRNWDLIERLVPTTEQLEEAVQMRLQLTTRLRRKVG